MFSRSAMSSSSHLELGHCPLKGCDFYGSSLRRHLRSKEHNSEIDSQQTDTLVQSANKRKIGKGKTWLSYKPCPIKDCNVLTCHFKHHLRSKKNHVKVDPRDIDILMKVVDERGMRTKRNPHFYRVCPIEGCTFVTCYLRSHLLHRHKIQEWEASKTLLETAEIYRPNKLCSKNSSSVPTVVTSNIKLDNDIDDDDDGNDDNNDDIRQWAGKQNNNYVRECECQLTKEDFDAAKSLLSLHQSTKRDAKAVMSLIQ